MRIHEYQAKAVLARHGILAPRGEVASTPQEARAIAQRLGGRAVLKAQVHAGGRGRAGGIQVADSPERAEHYAAGLLGTRLVTHQTGPEGVLVGRVLVEEPAQVAQELYLAVLTDPKVRGPLVVASAAGGVEIEEVAAQSPERILTVAPDPALGLQPFQGRKLAYGMGLAKDLVRPFASLAVNLYRVYVANDCSLAEINPLVVTAQGTLLALDAKLNLEDDALFRHPELQGLRDPTQEDPLEVQAGQYDISYVKLDGDVGCMVNGAGLAMATMDVIKEAGAAPANFLDVGGGADQARVAQAFKLLLADPKVKRVLVNIFGGILRCDVAARGIVQAVKEQGVHVPVVMRMRGTNVEEGKQILRESGMRLFPADTMGQATELLKRMGR